jgi:hypothetical protein
MNYDFTIKDTDSHTWSPALGTDVADIIELSNTHFKDESAGMLKVDLHRGAKLITESIVNQLYYPNSEFVVVARHKETNKLGAWGWAKRNCLMEYSSEETTELRMIHIDKTLATRDRVALVGQLISIWHMWAQMNNIPVMVSATLRSQQRAFLRILEALGFTLNGSYAFMRTQIVADLQPPVADEQRIYVGTQR